MGRAAADVTSAFSIGHRQVFAIALPAMLANITTPLVGVVATAAIGRLGDAAALGGVAMASLVFDCLFWLCGFLRMGTVALTAQALGAGDRTEQRAVLGRALLIAIVIGAVLLAVQIPLAAGILWLMGGSVAVNDAAGLYFAIRLWSAPFALGNYVMLGWLVGLNHPRLALAVQIVVNVVDILLTVLFVLVLDGGVAGAAWAAVIAEGSGLAAGLALAWHVLGHRLDMPRHALFNRAKLVRMLAVNRDIFIRTAALVAAFLFFSAQGARAGDVTLAANAVLHNFTLIGAFFLDGMANAAEQLCGRAYGARDRSAFSRAVKLIVGWSLVFGLATSIAFALGGPFLIDAMTASADVRDTARLFLWLAMLTPVCGALTFAYDGIYIGVTWVRDMRNLMIVALTIYFAVWRLTQPLGNAGLWLALVTFYLVRGVLQAARYPTLARRTFGTMS
ncbi:MAG: MATE family efflux transporter [Rhizobiales bacterium 64-17]|nr:MAG: MATE family efflux transporter [Rhizobiales bacterium 64-17]